MPIKCEEYCCGAQPLVLYVLTETAVHGVCDRKKTPWLSEYGVSRLFL